MSPDIQLRQVTQRFGDVTALDSVDLTLAGGRIHGLLGRNGSGKTTLLSVAAAFLRPTRGQALIGGEPVWENPSVVPDVCLVRGSGDVVEDDWPDNRVRNALDFAAAMRPRWDADLAAGLLDTFELDPDRRLPELSRGQRSAVGIVLGLATRAPVTLLDESYLGLDAPSRYAFYDALLADVAAHPRTVVISTHLIEEVSRLFDDVTIIEAGRVLLHEPAEALRGRGIAVTGPAETVDAFVDGQTVLAERSLGPTKAVTVFGDLDEDRRRAAAREGLTLEPIALQDLFVHLTQPTEARR